MKNFILRLFIFLIIALVSVEIYIRMNHLTIDIPQRTINDQGIQAYKSNQTGYWSKGAHTWQINAEGWPGKLPQSMNHLITLIGDSHIENFMNPNECNLGTILNNEEMRYNFLEVGRSGATFIEYLEISKYLYSKYNPELQFVFVKESDFSESLLQRGRRQDVTQVNLKERKIIDGELKNPALKKFLYSIKTLYFFRSALDIDILKLPFRKGNQTKSIKEDKVREDAQKLLEYVASSYDTKNILFFLHPETREEIVDVFDQFNLQHYKFNAKNNLKWRNSKNDVAHWNCFGFQEAAKQIINLIN
ncbi:hypothetical protein ACFQ3R_06245 [Mesonia ostreae]|uniref:SGNH/GDSL hydrolase family protein n=1 Tax=Mesonia ostreae TaxID=861110 RepID=A0ABU2KH92_9FLAO|nr:hypothetical protein [Mesonia ostreae]MDT0294059.1 hypothetical protein [Mesonia ostreae]